ncbi:MAG TPA: hypothetical protein DD761_20115 [Cyanobacteria bacterium UBA11691]|nr:hypothetical protein [Cyanobacteria bacterium UBA11691]
MFIQLTDSLIVENKEIRRVVLCPSYPRGLTDEESDNLDLDTLDWSVKVLLINSTVKIFSGDRQEAAEHFGICASYLGQSHQRGLIPLHEVAQMVNPTPVQEA